MDFTNNFSSINLLVVFGATLAANILGGLWYSPVMFGKFWRKAMAMQESSGGATAGTFVSSFVLHLIAASMLAAMLGVGAGGMAGLQLGAVIGVAFVFTAMGATNLFEHRPLSLIAINSGYHIVSLGMVGYIIGRWS